MAPDHCRHVAEYYFRQMLMYDDLYKQTIANIDYMHYYRISQMRQ